MSLEINMKEVKLVKGKKDDWIYISEDGEKETTKLMYANGESLSALEDNFENLASDNKMTAAEDLLGTLSFVTDVAEALAGAKAARIYNIM